jgi:hypothetical protein
MQQLLTLNSSMCPDLSRCMQDVQFTSIHLHKDHIVASTGYKLAVPQVQQTNGLHRNVELMIADCGLCQAHIDDKSKSMGHEQLPGANLGALETQPRHQEIYGMSLYISFPYNAFR